MNMLDNTNSVFSVFMFGAMLAQEPSVGCQLVFCHIINDLFTGQRSFITPSNPRQKPRSKQRHPHRLAYLDEIVLKVFHKFMTESSKSLFLSHRLTLLHVDMDSRFLSASAIPNRLRLELE